MLKHVIMETHLYPLTSVFSLLNWSDFSASFGVKKWKSMNTKGLH